MPDLSLAEFTLMQGAHLYTPEDQGIRDVLLANGKIIAVARDISPHIVPDCKVINLRGLILCPGFIDQHVHLIGGGGEAVGGWVCTGLVCHGFGAAARRISVTERADPRAALTSV